MKTRSFQFRNGASSIGLSISRTTKETYDLRRDFIKIPLGGQDIAGKNFLRPAISQKAQAKYARQFPKLNLFTIQQGFGGWAKADREHFADGGSLDQIYARK